MTEEVIGAFALGGLHALAVPEPIYVGQTGANGVAAVTSQPAGNVDAGSVLVLIVDAIAPSIGSFIGGGPTVSGLGLSWSVDLVGSDTWLGRSARYVITAPVASPITGGGGVTVTMPASPAGCGLRSLLLKVANADAVVQEATRNANGVGTGGVTVSLANPAGANSASMAVGSFTSMSEYPAMVSAGWTEEANYQVGTSPNALGKLWSSTGQTSVVIGSTSGTRDAEIFTLLEIA